MRYGSVLSHDHVRNHAGRPLSIMFTTTFFMKNDDDGSTREGTYIQDKGELLRLCSPRQFNYTSGRILLRVEILHLKTSNPSSSSYIQVVNVR